MRDPVNLKIGGFQWTLVFCPTLSDWGECQLDERILKIRQVDETDEKQFEILVETLFHEILHAVWNQAGIDSKKEEKQVDKLARGLASVFVGDNAEFVDFFRELV